MKINHQDGVRVQITIDGTLCVASFVDSSNAFCATTNEFHRFSPLDEIISPLYSAFILTFPCLPSHKDNVLSTLSRAWSRTLDERPPLRGKIVYHQSQGARPGSLELRISELIENANLVVNDMTHPGQERSWNESYHSLKAQGMPPRKMDGKILAPLVSGVGETDRVVTVQINFIPGGCLLAFCTSHSFMDAYGCALVLQAWAKHCREIENLSVNEIANSSYDPKFEEANDFLMEMENSNYEELNDRVELWHLLGLHATKNLRKGQVITSSDDFRHIPAAVPPQGSPVTTTCIFVVDPTSLKRLKEDATPAPPDWISSGDALVALLWRSIMRARFPLEISRNDPNARQSIVSVALDGRQLLSPPHSPSYIGNVVFCCMTKLPTNVLLSPGTSLAETAVAIRKDIKAAKKPPILGDAISLAASLPDVSSLKIAFEDFLGADLVTTSWVELPFYEIEFGPIFGKTGKADFFQIPNEQFGGICSLGVSKPDV